MKKNFEYVNLDSATAKWLMENLPQGELKQGVTKLVSGDCTSLVLESDGDNSSLAPSIIKCGNLIINEKTRRVEESGKEISLTPKEYDILLFLAHNRGEVFTKEQIYNAVWEENYIMDDSNIMAFIRKLRKKIEPNPDAPIYIQTIWGIGYKFNDNL